MLTRSLGSSGPAVSALGLGCMGMSGMYGPADRAESIATIHAALDAGIIWYTFTRASQVRKLRVPRPRVRAGEAIEA